MQFETVITPWTQDSRPSALVGVYQTKLGRESSLRLEDHGNRVTRRLMAKKTNKGIKGNSSIVSFLTTSSSTAYSIENALEKFGHYSFKSDLQRRAVEVVCKGMPSIKSNG